MILAAAEYVEGLSPPPDELRYFSYGSMFGALPEYGGLRDQRAGELPRMLYLKNVADVWQVWINRPKGWTAIIGQSINIIEQVKALKAWRSIKNG